jgi:glutaredoxin
MLKVYSKAQCPFCDRAKNLLKLKGIEFEEVRVDLDTSAREFIIERGHRTVPQIYLNDELYVENGYTGLSRLTENDFQQLKERTNVN